MVKDKERLFNLKIYPLDILSRNFIEIGWASLEKFARKALEGVWRGVRGYPGSKVRKLGPSLNLFYFIIFYFLVFILRLFKMCFGHFIVLVLVYNDGEKCLFLIGCYMINNIQTNVIDSYTFFNSKKIVRVTKLSQIDRFFWIFFSQ